MSIPKKASQSYSTMYELSAIHHSVMMIEDNSDDNNLLNLDKLRAKNKRRRRRKARKICCLYDKMQDNAADFKTKLSIKETITKVFTTGAKDRSN